MKVTNIILSIIILLLAIVLAVSSFFLYEKRIILVNGWDTLTTNIHSTAAELDKNSGTNVAAELTPEKLHHTNYASLETQLQKLNESASKLIKQRDNLAMTLVEISKILEAGSRAPAHTDITNVESGATSAAAVASQAETFKKRRDAVLESLVRSGRLIGVSINVNDLKSGNSAKVFKAFDDKIKALQAQLRAYETASREIGRVSDAGSLTFNAANYRTSLAKLQDSVKKLKDKYNRSQRDLQNANRRISQLQGDVKQRDKRITDLNTTIKNKDIHIQKLSKVLNIPADKAPAIWSDGSRESRLEVRGKVIEINEKFGFYVVNLGNNTRVKQPVGNRINSVDPKLSPDMKMTVARNMNSPEVKFVAKAKITNVADECIIIELIGSNNNKVLVGDDVFFAAEDLK